MNISKGDIVQHKEYPNLQGIVVKTTYEPMCKYGFGNWHSVHFHSGLGFETMDLAHRLKVIRRAR